MSDRRRILVVEDEYFIASDLARDLEAFGAEVVGPIATVDRALERVATEERLDGAVLDINLNGEVVFPVADALRARNVPILFTTGYEQGAIPERYSGIERCEKPITVPRLKRAAAVALKLGT